MNLKINNNNKDEVEEISEEPKPKKKKLESTKVNSTSLSNYSTSDQSEKFYESLVSKAEEDKECIVTPKKNHVNYSWSIAPENLKNINFYIDKKDYVLIRTLVINFEGQERKFTKITYLNDNISFIGISFKYRSDNFFVITFQNEKKRWLHINALKKLIKNKQEESNSIITNDSIINTPNIKQENQPNEKLSLPSITNLSPIINLKGSKEINSTKEKISFNFSDLFKNSVETTGEKVKEKDNNNQPIYNANYQGISYQKFDTNYNPDDFLTHQMSKGIKKENLNQIILNQGQILNNEENNQEEEERDILQEKIIINVNEATEDEEEDNLSEFEE
jgi:hypothetical protein